MDLLDPNGKGPLAKVNPKYCDAKHCRFSLSGQVKERRFLMNFVIARKTADLGFFPQLMRDIPAVEKKIDRKISRYPSPQERVGIYFETARLPQGTHTWDFWIYFPDKDADKECSFKIQRRNVTHLLPVKKS